jgi:predicted ATPase with chaperone activity
MIPTTQTCELRDMAQIDTLDHDQLLATILSDEAYRPAEPGSLQDTGIPIALIESLLLKRLLVAGATTGRKLAESICLPFRILEDVFQSLRSRQIIVHHGSAPLNDYVYALTDQGRTNAQMAMTACGYVGPAPVPLTDYVLASEAQTIRAEAPKRSHLKQAFSEISVDDSLFDALGPAVNSGAGLFLYGDPGNGKSTLAKRITMCFGQRIWIPHALIEDGQIIKLYDAAIHEADQSEQSSIIRSASYDRRWVKIRRPTVVVGGELTMESLEIRHDPHSNVSEAPVQLKSNCGCLLVDDFGRQRIEPSELLNRWIVPLESRTDYLTLSTGKKIAVPFEQLIIFSTNLEPADLVDEAFLRRIPYKIEVTDPTTEEFFRLFEMYAEVYSCEYRREVIEYLLDTHYRPYGRCMRRCHPRDLLGQIKDYCTYNDVPMAMEREYFDRVVRSYFTVVSGKAPTGVSP